MTTASNSVGFARVAVVSLLSTFLLVLTPASQVVASVGDPGQSQSVIAVGSRHSLAIDGNGKLFAWGDNTSGQLGNGTGLDTNVPVAVSTAGFPPNTSFKSVAASSDTSFALSSTGKLYGWGSNANGQLGDGSTVSRQTPVEVAISGVVFTQIAVASNHALGLTADGTVYSWGKNNFGQLGNSSNVDQVVPVRVDTSGIAESKVFVSIAAGFGFSLAVTQDGMVYSWGANSGNRLGDGSGVNQTSPVPISTSNIASGVKFADVAAGSGHSLALATDGSLYGWGNNRFGSLGDGTNISRPIPVLVPTSVQMPGDSVVAISAGSDNSMALTSGGQLFAWGSGSSGSLGAGSRSNANTPTAVATSNFPAGTEFYSIVTGANNSMALTSTGELYSWGYNGDGQLGIGLAPLIQPTPLAVATSSLPIGTTFSAIAVGYDHSLALSSEGLIYAWGANDKGQLGDGTQSRSAVPIPVSINNFPVGTTFSQIVAGKQYSMALSATGDIYAWGDNSGGQLGINSSVDSLLPVAPSRAGFSNPTQTFSSIAVGWYHSLALTAAGDLYTWGSRDFEQLVRNGYNGNNKIPMAADAARLPSGVTFSNLAATPLSTLALGSDGSIYGWGDNSWGQLGNGFNTYNLASSYTTVSTSGVLSGKSMVQIAGGTNYFIGRDSTGSLYGWGANTDEYSAFVGQLGVGSSPALSNIPLATDLSLVPNGTTFTFASTNYYSSTAITAAGDLYAWGENSDGQLGNKTQVDTYFPTAVSTISNPVGTVFKSFYAGSKHSVALSVDGLLYAQGRRDAGQLGDGVTTLYQLTPASLAFQGLAYSPVQLPSPLTLEDAPTPSYTGPILNSVEKSVAAGSTVVFSGSKLDLITGAHVGLAQVEITGKTSVSLTIKLPTTLAAGSYNLVVYSSYGQLTVLKALSIKTSIQSGTNSDAVESASPGSQVSLSDLAQLLIGKSRTIPKFVSGQTDLSDAQSAWLKSRIGDSGLTNIVCTGVLVESMTMHQKIQVKKITVATCEEAAEMIGSSSVTHQSKMTTKASFAGVVMLTFKR